MDTLVFPPILFGSIPGISKILLLAFAALQISWLCHAIANSSTFNS